MKTFLEKLILHIDFITNPSGCWLPSKAETRQKPKKATSISIKNSVSPDRVAMRSSSKKGQQLRHTPAP
jgi:hypothetical protein